MIVDGECFFGKLSVNFQRPNAWVGGDHFDQLEPQPAFERALFSHVIAPDDVLALRAAEQLAVVQRSERVAFGHAGGRTPLAVGGDKDIVGLIQVGQEALVFLWAVIPVHLKVEIVAVDPAVRIIAACAERQAHVPGGFVGRRAAAHCHRATFGDEAQIIGLAQLELHRRVEGKGQRDTARVTGRRVWNFHPGAGNGIGRAAGVEQLQREAARGAGFHLRGMRQGDALQAGRLAGGEGRPERLAGAGQLRRAGQRLHCRLIEEIQHHWLGRVQRQSRDRGGDRCIIAHVGIHRDRGFHL